MLATYEFSFSPGASNWKITHLLQQIERIRNIFSAKELKLLVWDTRQTEKLAGDSW